MVAQEYVTLERTGDKMPLVGFGCWKIDPSDCEETIYTAIKLGYRMIDSAQIYGNEVEVGRGIKRAINEGIIKREDLFCECPVTKRKGLLVVNFLSLQLLPSFGTRTITRTTSVPPCKSNWKNSVSSTLTCTWCTVSYTPHVFRTVNDDWPLLL